jgi:hypothetical protein
MYIGARIFQTLMREGERGDLKYLISCLRRLDEQLCIKSSSDSNIPGSINLLTSGLEVGILSMPSQPLLTFIN